MTATPVLLSRSLSESTSRKLGRIHQIARYVSRVECRAPDFLIVGAQKGGTTSLYSYLAQHPNVIPAVRKEVHYFENPSSRARGESWYRSFFATESYLRRHERRLGSTALTGEATTYMPYPRIPRMLHQVSPSARLIFLLRNPVERAYSHYRHICRSYPGTERHTFSEAIRIEPQRIQPDLDAIARDEWHDDATLRLFSYCHSGLYAEQLKAWLEHFPRENMYITESERFFERPGEIVAEVRNFLTLPAYDFDFSKKFNVGGYTDQISRDDREFLIDKFSSDRAELREILGPDFGTTWF